jgi:hypothetical protein
MELESSSPYPQVPATCPYPEPAPASPHDPLQFPEDHILQPADIYLNGNQFIFLYDEQF